MGSLVVIALSLFLGHAPDLIECVEDIAIHYLRAISAIKPFDKSILRWFARLNELQYDVPTLRPLSQEPADEFRAVVHPQSFRLAVYLDQLIKCPSNPSGRLAGVNLNAKCFAPAN